MYFFKVLAKKFFVNMEKLFMAEFYQMDFMKR